MISDLRLTNAQVLQTDGLASTPLRLSHGLITDDSPARHEVDLKGFLILPGIVDIHGDGFERHLAPRRGVMKDLDQGIVAAEAEIATNGITTATLAQFYSWEGGMRGAEFAARFFTALTTTQPCLITDLRTQLRFEISMIEEYQSVEHLVEKFDIPYLVFNDHLPHDALVKGNRPPRLTGQALRIGRSPENHLKAIQALHDRMGEVPAALSALTKALAPRGVLMGSHDDRTTKQRRNWHEMGVHIAEFPESEEAVIAAKNAGDPVILGAPNVVRGGSHNGNVSAADMIRTGRCDAMASDYHYPSLRHAAFFLADTGVCDLTTAWSLISSGPAEILGLTDRGSLTPGRRADLVVLDAQTRDVCATITGGRVSFMRGEVAHQLLM